MTAPSISVRMYKKLLGDCFLLTIGDPAAPRDKRIHILIDCGVLQHVPREKELMQAVAKDIVAVTEKRLDLLIITHEHWDHLSGFAHEENMLIHGMEIDRLWLGWTEERGDPQADMLREQSQAAKAVVNRIVERSAAFGLNVTANLENFNGPVDDKGKLRAAKIIPALIAKAKVTDYLQPGEIRQIPNVPSLRAFVLGPPRHPKYLTKSKPSGGAAKETYLAETFELGLNERYAVAASLGDALETDGPRAFARFYPIAFDTVAQATTDRDTVWLRDRYLDKSQAWRKIDDAWLGVAGSLALKLDSDTNNTSLALAFELEPGGDVMLFPGDAQVGSWLSWHEQGYPATAPAGVDTPKITARDLLARTVLYKVGHHASHNATLDKLGLALMTNPNLVAMIPVNEAEARREKDGKAVHKGWDMPFQDLLDQLMLRTSNRVLRGDANPGCDPDGKVICADQAFLNKVEQPNDLYLQYKVR